MPRRLIIGILVVLILGVLGGTVYMVVQRLRTDDQSVASATPSPGAGTLQQAETGNQRVLVPTADEDGDGLLNADETLWGTDPTNADTDGDGYKDGEEVAANHNPTIPAPNDTLPPGFAPGAGVPEAGPPPVSQYFATDLDLSGGSTNLTDAYRQQYPEAQRTPDTLVAFAKSQPIVTTLPQPRADAIKLEAADTPLVMAEYMEVAGSLAVFSNRTLIAEALDDIFTNGNGDLMRGLAASVRLHQERLISMRVPPSAHTLQQLLLGYTELVAATYEQIARYDTDPVKGVVGTYQLEQIDARYIPLLEEEIARLNQLLASLRAAS